MAFITGAARGQGRSHAIRLAIPKVHAEDGCELYALHQADDRVMMIEKWASREALGAHSQGAALAALRSQLAGKIAGPAEVIVLEAVSAGDPGKGQL